MSDKHTNTCNFNHPLKLQQLFEGDIECKVCRYTINDENYAYYNCGLGCNFDICLECYGLPDEDTKTTLMPESMQQISQIKKAFSNGVGSEAEIRKAFET